MSFAPLAVAPSGVARRSPRVAALALLIAFGGAGGALAETPLPDSENGRYTFTPSADGVVRLDTRTGKVSTCTDKGSGWACYAIADERAAFDAETGRLQAEIDRLKKEADALRAANDSLKAQLASAGQPGAKTDEAMPKSDRLPQPQVTEKDGQRKLEIPLPSDQDVDRVMGFLERAWRKLIDMATRVQRDISGDKI
ncbi:hypothetical protein BJ123_12542 [Rhodopseudomonas thermotolerans]|uniref:Uncharacterized protein n=2 Tax=Rhodopseudomonas TaxID=1073 RepID=A0A336JSS2_9BRAD|nr:MULTISPECIES: hypothetical protein [Rhodopseudomonas]RED27690.1 hypothetical protein BJ125_12542 [Rhodopseudomonas pentothenatexigens]REF91225.1 hypothetical protein BJ123_12542 [Rhodopseudomonas thermotolerans]SSW92835.1 hypothetical protein SAMN05892882_12542 [Rhodopseudomonas pentothenatexigens]